MEQKERLKAEARAASAEFMATFLFVYFGAGSVSAAAAASGNTMSSKGSTIEPVNYALSFGFGITVLAFAIGNLSGGHINPAVTVSMLVTDNISPSRGVMYIIAQISGGLCGGGLLRASLDKDTYFSGIGLSDDVTPGQGCIIECMGTLLLIFVVFNVAVWSARPLKNDIGVSTISALAPLPIGLAVMVSHLTLGPLTGCGINPARVLGAVVYEDKFWEKRAGQNFWIYWVGPLIAALIGPLCYWILHGTFKPGTADPPIETSSSCSKVGDSSTTDKTSNA